ncbi:hypothetical protein SEA_FLATHEAD_23 [Mycobacterium phage Flathead]|uniref:Uncharacterized protein n=43 Tax=Caudoviricetes TaxID=2731619 RepID=Q854M2_BPMOM|nr:minor tail protein [Mycobacterium phage Omega]YP_001469256.1 minor tail protein [Mycobacterium phage Tweety]YP_002241707.1 minor tail protein [Mycobacterium phage Fruitloop]YP_002241810.1 minor tail protein [Mycobacterium phage Ramsey]YP_003495163.1 minor tail protein [Mycobacterium phage Ardmore]YP_004123845.1 minor tail protein [Mycobacterium phage Wee]YP_008126615.1 minor tail protein [Mycobacterium phage Job42]YP_008408981.1 minor tail protein [Mycobacterium phage Bobi]YP_008409086.1
MNIKTDHQIVAFGNDMMGLFDRDGTLIVQAARVVGGWEVTAEGRPPATVLDRSSAITEMINTALAVLPGDGYSCLVPRGLRAQP